MSSDTSRHRLHTRLEEVLGPDPADTLMTHLPNVRWEDLATKQDLAQLKNELTAELTAAFRAEINEQTRIMVFALIAAMLTVTVIAFGAAFGAARLG